MLPALKEMRITFVDLLFVIFSIDSSRLSLSIDPSSTVTLVSMVQGEEVVITYSGQT